MSLTEAIDNELKLVPVPIRQRGKSLFNTGKVEMIDDDEFNGIFTFQVKGQEYPSYDVEVNIGHEYLICDVRCECNYAETGNICKHGVAAMLFLKAHLDGNQAEFFPEMVPVPKERLRKEPAKAQKLRQPIRIAADKAMSPEPEELLGTYVNSWPQGMLISSARILPGILEIDLKPGWEYGHFSPVKATMEWDDRESAFLFRCDDNLHNHLCEHIRFLMQFICRHKQINLLAVIRKETVNANLTAFLEKAGVALKKDERSIDLVEITLVKDKFIYNPRGRIKGLISSGRAAEYVRENVLNPLRRKDQKIQWVIPAGRPVDYNPLPAFVWEIREDRLQWVYAICGKPNKDKNKISSNLEEISGPYRYDMPQDEEFARAFFYKERLNEFLNDGQGDDLPARFQALTELAVLVKSRLNYIYFFSDWHNEGLPRKSDLKLIPCLLTDLHLKFHLSRDGDFYVFKAYLESPEGRVIDIETEVSFHDQFLVLTGKNELGILGSVKEAMALPAFYDGEIRVHHREYGHFLEETVIPLAEEFVVTFDDKSIAMATKSMETQQKRIYISELNQFVIFRPVMFYKENREVDVLDENSILTWDETKLINFERDVETEKLFIEEIAALHPSFQPGTRQTYFYLSYDEFKKDFWFLKAFESFKKFNIHVFGFNELKNIKFNPNRPTVSLGFSSGQDWFETEIEVAFGNNRITTRQLKKAVESGNAFIELTDGTLGILPEEWMKKFARLFRTAQVEKEEVRVSKSQFAMLEELVDSEINPEILKEIEQKKKRLSHFTGIKRTAIPKTLKAKLRRYQQQGFNWLNFLREFGWGGILADDMGLGKTLQALALICLELEQNPGKPNLVVAPTTLLFNWKNEIEKFTPKLDYFIHHGQRYDNPDELAKHMVVLTSYGIVIRDIDLLEKVNFNVIVADESQAIKNLHAKRHKSMVRLKGRMRLAMSGTPIENNIYELYAQMNFANPGFFQGFSAFKENYAKPVERNDNPEIIAELRNKIKPFILRRTKEQVLTELPEKTEEYLYCEMSPGQRKVYDAFRNNYRNFLLHKFEEEGLEKSQLYVLEGLTRLRQICDSPRLVEKEKLQEKASAKLDELVRHTLEKTGKHKILVFSQFVKMLGLIRDRFDEMDISYEYLDGQNTVKERERRVEHFQNDTNCRVFLISLKVGGIGLNLTSADYVYIVDPWWNPAVENQAIDRCYRIGQQKKVFAYRMFCKDTVEEKIINLQQRKKNLSEDVVGGGEGIMKHLGRSDIEALFS